MPSHKKCVVITGVSQGIGRALTEEFLKKDYTVFGCARHEPKNFRDKKFYFAKVDVSKNLEVKNWAKEINNMNFCPNILINNAAIVNKTLPLWDIPEKDFDALIDINIKGVANVLRAFLPAMIKNQKGIIVNMSSGWGQYGAANVSSYCASKFAIEGLTQSLSKELPKGLITISLSPGVLKTQMLKDCSPTNYESAIDATSWAKKAVPFIESLSEQKNGQSLSLDIR